MPILPVVHHLDDDLAEAQFELALECGADGAFLISHHGRDRKITALASRLASKYGAEKIGINLLTRSFADAYEDARKAGVGMIWSDAPGIHGPWATSEARAVGQRAKADGAPLVFAAVAFKYQRPEPRADAAARTAHDLGFIATTSGAGTGIAPDPSKIGAMRAALGPGVPLAIASGMAAWNVALYVRDVEGPLATHFLVSTAVSADEHRFDPAKLKAFVVAATVAQAAT